VGGSIWLVLQSTVLLPYSPHLLPVPLFLPSPNVGLCLKLAVCPSPPTYTLFPPPPPPPHTPLGVGGEVLGGGGRTGGLAGGAKESKEALQVLGGRAQD